PDEKDPPAEMFQIDGKHYRRLGQYEEVRPTRVRLHHVQKWFVKVDEGTRVKKGDLLALIDPVLVVDELSSKLAKFEASEADRLASEKIRDFYQKQWAARAKLHSTGGASLEEVNEARAGYDRYIQ